MKKPLNLEVLIGVVGLSDSPNFKAQIAQEKAEKKTKRFTYLDNRTINAIAAEAIGEAADEVGNKIDEYVRSKLPPRPRPLKQSQHWTPKQRRWWWGTMNRKAQGKAPFALPGWKAQYKYTTNQRGQRVKKLFISGSYRRTGTMIKSLTWLVDKKSWTEVSKGGHSYDVPIVIVYYGTNVPYARYVIDEELQAEYHAGNWETLQTIIERKQHELSAFYDRLVDRLITEKMVAILKEKGQK